MGISGLKRALLRGEPLVDVVVLFRSGIEPRSATERINSLAEDFDLDPRPWHNDPRLRIGTATREALDRMFGWELRRAPVPNEQSSGSTYWWDEVTAPSRFPEGLAELIETIGLSQPGADDDGQWWE